MPRRRALIGLVLAVVVVGIGGVAAVRRDAGPLLASVALGPAPGAPAVDEASGRVFVADHVDGYLRVLDARTGRLLRTVTIGRDGPMAVDERRGLLFLAGAWNGPDKYGVYNDHAIVRVLDARTGRLLRTLNTGVTDDAVAIAVDAPLGRLFLVFPGTVLVLDTGSGAVLRSVAAAPGASMATVDERSGRAFVVNDGDGSVSVFDARRGTILRTVMVGAAPSGVAVDARAGHVFVPTANGVAVLDARSGAPWRTVRRGHSFGAVAVDAQTGRAFATDAGSGPVSVLDTHSGAILRTVRAGRAPSVIAIDEQAGRVFVGSQGLVSRANPTGAGSVAVLEARSGAVLRSITLGNVTDLAVDERAGRAFVITRDVGGIHSSDRWSWLPPWLRSRLPWVPPPPAPPSARTIRVTMAVSVLDATYPY